MFVTIGVDKQLTASNVECIYVLYILRRHTGLLRGEACGSNAKNIVESYAQFIKRNRVRHGHQKIGVYTPQVRGLGPGCGLSAYLFDIYISGTVENIAVKETPYFGDKRIKYFYTEYLRKH